jgi:glucokinase
MERLASETLVLAGDIGGTNLSLALAAVGPQGVRRLHTATRPSAGEQGVEAAVEALLHATRALGRPEAACFAAAGPVVAGRIELTNQPWSLDRAALSRGLGMPVALLNDFSALVHAALRLAPGDARAMDLSPGIRPDPAGPVLVVGAGTGLGVGYGFKEGDRCRVFSSEGGHVGLPVFDEVSAALHAEFAATEQGPPDAELVVCGSGLARILAFLVGTGRAPRTPRAEAILAAPEAERPRLVSAGAPEDPACAMALAHFLATYARVCADLTAAFLPSGGLFLAGGVTARLAAHFQAPDAFMAPYLQAYRPHVAALLRATPIRVLTDYALSLDGAAWAAADLRMEHP